eukprot:8037416-Pyramimonas_sp.AAC.1
MLILPILITSRPFTPPPPPPPPPSARPFARVQTKTRSCNVTPNRLPNMPAAKLPRCRSLK